MNHRNHAEQGKNVWMGLALPFILFEVVIIFCPNQSTEKFILRFRTKYFLISWMRLKREKPTLGCFPDS